jgi:hypothetical protein
MSTHQNSTHGNPIISWILRGFLFAVALFFMLFSFDVFSENVSVWQKMGSFIIHNVFTIFFLGTLYVAWRREHYAGSLLIVLSVCMIFFFEPSGIRIGTWMMISLPAITGFLFLANYFLLKPKTKA